MSGGVGSFYRETTHKLHGRDKEREESLSYDQVVDLLTSLKYQTEVNMNSGVNVDGHFNPRNARPDEILDFVQEYFDPEETGLNFSGTLEVYHGDHLDKHQLILHATADSLSGKIAEKEAKATIDYTVTAGEDPRQDNVPQEGDASVDNYRQVAPDRADARPLDEVFSAFVKLNRSPPFYDADQVTEAVKETADRHGCDVSVVDEEYDHFSLSRIWYALTRGSIPELRETHVHLDDKFGTGSRGRVSFRYKVDNGEVKGPTRLWYKDSAALSPGTGSVSKNEMNVFLNDVLDKLDQ